MPELFDLQVEVVPEAETVVIQRDKTATLGDDCQTYR
jgi:hypothetical protein